MRVEVDVRLMAGTAWPLAPMPNVVVEKNSLLPPPPPPPLPPPPKPSWMLKKLLRPMGAPRPKPIGEKNGVVSELLACRDVPTPPVDL